MLLSVCAMYGQKSNVNKAESIVNYGTGTPEELEKAQTLIDAALKDPSTENDARTWYTAGFIQEKILQGEQIKGEITRNDDKVLRGESTLKAIDYFTKAYDLDQLPDEKGKVKPKYNKKIMDFMRNYPAELINYGYYRYEEKDYAQTLAIWEKYLDMAKLPYMKGIVPESDADTSVYNRVIYQAAIVAVLDENTDKAIVHLESIKDKYNINECYQYLAQQYLTKKDTAGYFNTIKTGFEKYPTNTYMLESLINYYLLTGNDLDGGLNYLNAAIRLKPDMAQYYYVRGNIYEVKGQQDDAVKDFEKTLQLDDSNAGAHFGLGRYYYKKGELYMERINNIRDAKIAQQETAKAKEIFEQAAASMEKCRALDPKNADNLNLLKRTYYRIYQDENHPKYKDVSKAIKEL